MMGTLLLVVSSLAFFQVANSVFVKAGLVIAIVVLAALTGIAALRREKTVLACKLGSILLFFGVLGAFIAVPALIRISGKTTAALAHASGRDIAGDNNSRGNTPSDRVVLAKAGRGGYLLPKGWFTTKGAQIVDDRGNPVRIASVGLPGDDGTDGALRFLRSVSYQTTFRGAVADGFNTVRIAWADITLNGSPKAGAIDRNLNPDLRGLSSMEVLDKIVDYAGTIGLRVIFDHHTNDGGEHGWGGQQSNGLWFDKGPGSDGTDGNGNPGTITAEQFQKNTLALVKRYLKNPTVIGYDLDNEPLSRGAGGVSLNWGQGGPTDIWKMYTDLGNAILALNPKLLIICEGPEGTSNTGNGLAGIGPEGDLSAVGGTGGVPAKPVILKVPNQVVYSVHEYDTNVYDYGANEQPSTLIPHMNEDWGYLYTRNIAPVWIGEMGSNLEKPQDRVWAQTLLDYMNGKYGAQGGPVFKAGEQPVGGSWWLWGHFAGEQTDGTLESDWATPRPDQQGITDQMLFRLAQAKPGGGAGAGPSQ